jgi:hypothetical protein
MSGIASGHVPGGAPVRVGPTLLRSPPCSSLASFQALLQQGCTRRGAAPSCREGPCHAYSQLSHLVALIHVVSYLPCSVEIPWTPHYKVALRHGSTAVHMTGACIHERRPSEPLIAATEEGRVMAIDWAPQGEGTGSELWSADAADSTAGGVAESAGGGGGKAKAAIADDGDGGAATGSSALQRILWVGQVSALIASVLPAAEVAHLTALAPT